MGSNLKYLGDPQLYADTYWHSKIIGVLWAIFTLCYVLIGATAFFAPEWIAIENETASGKIGLWSVCFSGEIGEVCRGNLENFMSLPGKNFQAVTIIFGLAVFAGVLTLCAMLFFLCCHSSTVFFTCAWMQLFSGMCMATGCAIFPLGWNEEVVQKICINSNRFVLGQCNFGWGYLLAIIGCLDAFILCFLAFILATRYGSTQTDSISLCQGGINPEYLGDSISIAESRKSLNLQPVFLMHPGHDDTYSQFSQKTTPRSLCHYSHTNLPYSAHNFQL